MTQEQAPRGSLLVPLVAGLAGAGLALLFAPRSGRETRAKVQETAHDVKDQVRETLTAAKGEFGEEVQHIRAIKHKLGNVVKSNRRRGQQETEEMPQEQSQILTSWDREV